MKMLSAAAMSTLNADQQRGVAMAETAAEQGHVASETEQPQATSESAGASTALPSTVTSVQASYLPYKAPSRRSHRKRCNCQGFFALFLVWAIILGVGVWFIMDDERSFGLTLIAADAVLLFSGLVILCCIYNCCKNVRKDSVGSVIMAGDDGSMVYDLEEQKKRIPAVVVEDIAGSVRFAQDLPALPGTPVASLQEEQQPQQSSNHLSVPEEQPYMEEEDTAETPPEIAQPETVALPPIDDNQPKLTLSGSTVEADDQAKNTNETQNATVVPLTHIVI